MKNTVAVKNMDPTVFIVEDDATIAEAIKWLIGSIHIHTEIFPHGKAYLDTHDPIRKGCLVIDVRMPVMSGLELQERLNQQNNSLPIIFITGHGDISMAVRAMQMGAFHFITKPFNDQLLLEQVQKAIEHNANQAITPDISAHAAHYAGLTAREKEIMKLVVAGKLNKQIAYELNIALSTTELHRSHMMEKMRVKSLAEIIKIYLALEVDDLQ